ncbi:MAG: toll/interleukin-1 receptor domain-containing protein [Candidatus Marinimicrobia bacterium]|nr:toll/interleukin-1 receptor domain-containing protein [Candidatus Neomarinimicrobiota bacterium]MBL7046047.1 toll/interleukin-1 receptor domain-containing protein [Candidatus Neomarinimicrobiota bacterium]
MKFISEKFLLEKAKNEISELTALATELKKNNNEIPKKIFLSHCHLDRELARGLYRFLLSFKVYIYIDWMDSAMPATTNGVTAQKIKDKIDDCDYVLVLATQNAVNSKWVPWEIGVSDVLKTPDKILIIPIVDSAEKFKGNEYLQLYKSIQITSLGHHEIIEPNKTSGIKLESWLKSIGPFDLRNF